MIVARWIDDGVLTNRFIHVYICQIKALVDAATGKGLQRFQERFNRVFALSGSEAKNKGYKGCVLKKISPGISYMY